MQRMRGKIFKNEPLVPMNVTSEHEQVQSISKEESRSLLSNDLNLSADLELQLESEPEIESEQLKNHEDVYEIIRLMVLATDTTLPRLSNNLLTGIYNHWKLNPNDDLPLYNPTKYTPYEFHSQYNQDRSYIITPRLSVTKLLVSSWCELRSFYQVYSGSVRLPSTKAMTQGTKLHSKLEAEVHPEIDTTEIEQFLISNAMSLRELQTTVPAEEETVVIDLGEVEQLAVDWAEMLIERLFSLIMGAEAREILLHGYLNLKNRLFVTNKDEIRESSSVLVSGIVDYIKFQNVTNPSDGTLFDDIHGFVDSAFDQVDNVPLVDLSQFLPEAKQILQNYDFRLTFTDVKTRSARQIPRQESVLEAAKFQTFYYRHFFHLLSRDSRFTYFSLIENAERRGHDVDKPLSILTTISLLRKHYHIFFKDFVKLANGEPIGFSPFDDSAKSIPYDFVSMFQSSDEFSLANPNHNHFLEQILEIDGIEYDLILSPLLKVWKTPPTLRYLAARASQLFNVFNENIGDITSVEYRYNKTSELLLEKVYDYNFSEFQAEVESASKFWNGEREVIPTEDLLRCSYCEFQSKCMVAGGKTTEAVEKKTIGPKIRQFLNECESSSKG